MEGDISSAILGFTILCIVWGFLLGLIRGRNRSILRCIIVLGCAVLAFFLKDALIESFMTMEVDGETLEDALIASLVESGDMPEYLSNMMLSLVEVIIGLVAFIVLFYGLKMVTWLILFPILKIFVKKEEEKKTMFGGLIGLIQGIIIAFVICSPITGAMVQVDRLANIKIGGESIGEEADLPDFSDYLEGPIASVYTATGSWFFDAITTYTDGDGNQVTLEQTVEAAETGTKVLEEVEKITESLKKLDEPEEGATKSDVLRDVAESLGSMDEVITGTSDNGKQILQQLIESVGEMAEEESGSGDSEEGSSSETSDKISEIVGKMDVEDLKLDSAAEAIEGIADYLEKEDSEALSVKSTEKIVNGLADNMIVIEMIPEDTKLVEIKNAEDKENFKNAIEETDLSDEEKDKLLEILGLK